MRLRNYLVFKSRCPILHKFPHSVRSSCFWFCLETFCSVSHQLLMLISDTFSSAVVPLFLNFNTYYKSVATRNAHRKHSFESFQPFVKFPLGHTVIITLNYPSANFTTLRPPCEVPGITLYVSLDLSHVCTALAYILFQLCIYYVNMIFGS